MTRAAPTVHPAHFREGHAPRRQLAVAAHAAKGLLLGFYDALLTANQRLAQRDIDRFVSTKGGRLTDNLERDISSFILKDSANGWSHRS